MKNYYLLAFFLIAGISAFIIYNKLLPDAPAPINQTVQNNYLIAPAVIDSQNDMTRISSLQSGLLKHIHVAVGDKVKKGQALFSLESKLVKNTLKINQLSLEQTNNEILLKEERLNFLEKQLNRMHHLDKRAIIQSELEVKKQEVKLEKAQLAQARYNHFLAEANVKQTQLMLNQLTIRAPKDGLVLQINTHPHEFITTGQTIALLADANKIIVRISLDERDIFRFNPKAQALLLTYNPAKDNKLTFIQLDKYITVQERLNSRVQEALYYLDREAYPELVAGQLFDVRIDLSTLS